MTTPTPPTPPGWYPNGRRPLSDATGTDLNGALKRRRRNWLQAGNGRRGSAPSRSLPTHRVRLHPPTRRLAADIPLRGTAGGNGDNWTRNFEGSSRMVCGVEGVVGTQRDDGRVTRRIRTIHSGGADLEPHHPPGRRRAHRRRRRTRPARLTRDSLSGLEDADDGAHGGFTSAAIARRTSRRRVMRESACHGPRYRPVHWASACRRGR